MAQKGMCSRREADQLIEQGWVYVDGEVVDRLGSKVKPSQQISLSPQAKGQQRRLATILLNKPLGYVSGQPQKGYQPAASLITAQNYYSRSGKSVPTPRTLRLPGLAPAGRLDIDSQGLLVLTQDGRIARQLISPESDIEKQYLVRVRGHITESKISQLCQGLSLDHKHLRPALVSVIGENRLCFVLTEGRKRQIRRMCALVQLDVIGLQRVRIGAITLGALPLGKWRFVGAKESFCTR